MASSYVNDLRLNEMATGDASGTWGETTNTNLELIAEAFSYGTEAITTNADTHTTTIADGATDPGRSMFLKYTGTLDSTCTITIGPNTVSKLWIIENGTSGSQSIIIKQGSGATVTIPSGKTKVIYSDGAGSGGAMVDAFASLNLQTSGIIESSSSIQTPLIEFTDGDDAMTIADGGQVTFAQNIIGTLGTAAQANITSLGTLTGLTVNGDVTLTGSSNNIVFDQSDDCLEFADNAKAKFGASDDLQIYHDGSNSRIQEGGTGSLLVRGSNLQLQDSDGFDYMTCTDGGDGGTVALKHLGSTVLSTASGGITVTSAINDLTIAAGNIQTNTSNNLSINTPNSVRINIDSNDSATDQVFVIGKNQTGVDASNDVLFKIGEDGKAGIGVGAPNATLHVGSSNATGDATNPAIQIGGSSSYRLGMYTTAEGAVIDNNNGDDGISFFTKTNGEMMRLQADGVAHITSAGAPIAPSIKHGGATGDVSKLRLINRAGQGSNKGGLLELGGVTNDGVSRSDVFASLAGLKDNATSGNKAGYMQFSTSNGSSLDEKMRLDSNGNLLVGNTSSGGSGKCQADVGFDAMDGSNTVSISIRNYSSGANSGQIMVDPDGQGTDSVMYFNVDGVTPSKLKLDSAGRFNIDQVDTRFGTGALNITGEVGASFNAVQFRHNASTIVGTIVTGSSSTTYNTSSDYRLKENVDYNWDATTRLKQLKPARFNWISDETNTLVDGFLAHEVQNIVPAAITGEKDAMMDEKYEITPAVLGADGSIVTEAVMGTHSVPDYQNIDHSKLVPLLVKTIQELEARITALES